MNTTKLLRLIRREAGATNRTSLTTVRSKSGLTRAALADLLEELEADGAIWQRPPFVLVLQVEK